MPKIFAVSIFLFVMLAISSSNLVAATVSIGHYSTSSSTITIPVSVTGGELIKSMAGVLVVEDGGTVFGFDPVPTITAVDYSSSIWAGTIGGYTSDYSFFGPPSEFLFPNVMLNTPNQTVEASGQLLSFTLNLAGFPLGSTFALSMEFPPAAAATQLTLENGDTIVPTFVNGSITIVPEPSAIIFSVAVVTLCAFGMLRMRSRAALA